MLFSRSQQASNVQSYLIEILQTALTRQGFPVGLIDGDFGGKTESSVSTWQKVHGRTETGAVSEDDWAAITGLEPPSMFDRLLHVTARFEGTGMTGVVGNFDGAFLTFGIIGFTLKHDLPALLTDIENEIPDKARTAFGRDRWTTLLQVAQAAPEGREEFGNQVSIGPRKVGVLKPWKEAFERLGTVPEVQRLQLEHAFSKYYKGIALRDGNEFGAKSMRDLAVFYDTAVQNGGINRKKRELIQAALAANPRARGERRRLLWATAIAEGSSVRFRDDVFSRRSTLATGAGTVHSARFDLECWGINDRPVDLARLANDHVTVMPATFRGPVIAEAPRAPAIITELDWLEEVPVPQDFNGGLRAVNNSLMLAAFGNPRESYDQECRPPTDPAFRARVAFDQRLEPFTSSMWGLARAVDSLKAVLADIKREKPQIHFILDHVGMGCCRFQRNSTTKISNHSWGSAIDLTLEAKLDVRGNGVMQRGILEIAPIFHRHKWYSGATFRVEDAMHMEISRDWLAEHFPDLDIDSHDVSGFLTVGDSGPEIIELQRLLNAKGAAMSVDGDFGPATLAAVKAFQGRIGEMVDGVVGPRTLAALKA